MNPVTIATTTLSYSGSTFFETATNTGAVQNTRIITISGDTWTAGAFNSGNQYNVTNIPAGLTFSITRQSNSQLNLAFSGNASAHLNDVSNITLTFNSTAFTSGIAPTSENPKTLSIDFAASSPSTHTVFVSSVTFDGDMGGLAGADAKCQARADLAGLGGSWKAILSSSTAAAANRIAIVAPINNSAALQLASDASNFWDGTLDNEVDHNEFSDPESGGVWTGSNEDGSLAGSTCSDWSSSTGNGRRGRTGYESEWMVMDERPCTTLYKLYCINGQ